MYCLRQEYISCNKKEEISVFADDFESFKDQYFSLSKDSSDLSSYDKELNLSARIYMKVKFTSEKDFTIKKRVIKALSPIMEIALDRAIDQDDPSYLINYRKNGFYFRVEGDYMEFSLGDSNPKELAFSIVSMLYAVLYDEEILEKYNNKFELIRDDIVEGGFNSASFNGLQGYYFSNYFVKWLIDLRKYASTCDFINQNNFDEIFNLIDNLENPKDKIVQYDKVR